jgi:predicted RNase H-like HicB family nuclease
MRSELVLAKAEYKRLEDGTLFAEIPGYKGVWANSNTVEECRRCPASDGIGVFLTM